jgi:hypothetical protein
MPGRDGVADKLVDVREARAKDRPPPYDQDFSSDGAPAPGCTGALTFPGYVPGMAGNYDARALAMVDVNGDGTLDLVAPSWVALGLGNGAFASAIAFDTTSPSGFAVGDLDGDGRVDVVTVGDGLGVYLGQGDGSFSARTRYTCGKGARSVAVSDLNGDGRPDIVTANHDANTISLLLGKGDGTFAPSADFATGVSPSTVLVGDVDGDGKPDVVTVNDASDWSLISVLRGAGNGKLVDHVDTEGTDVQHTTTAVLGELNGDGKLDIVVSSVDATKVMLGKGDGRFAAPVSGTWGNVAHSLVLSDVNRDGKPDIVVLMAGAVRVLLGQGNGAFAAALDSPTSSDAVAAAVGDVDGDGNPDVVLTMATASFEVGAVGVLLGNGHGTFGGDRNYPSASHAGLLALGDVNGDGKLDVVTASEVGDSVSVLVGDGHGTLAASVSYPVGKDPIAIALGDVNGDGNLDIVTANAVPGDTDLSTVTLWFGRGDGSFGGRKELPMNRKPTALALGDLDADGNLDLVVTSDYRYLSVLLGKGSGSFAAAEEYEVGAKPSSVVLADLDGNGTVDIVTANAGYEFDGSISVLLGSGDGSFPSTTDYAHSGNSAFAVADLDGDGVLDIVTVDAMMKSRSVDVFFGKGDGTFADKPVAYPTKTSKGYALVVGDLDGDGRPDVVSADSDPAVLSVLLGDQDGGLSSGFVLPLGASALALGDLDGDRRPDVVALTDSGVTLLVTGCR